jgi:hypothetical protein
MIGLCEYLFLERIVFADTSAAVTSLSSMFPGHTRSCRKYGVDQTLRDDKSTGSTSYRNGIGTCISFDYARQITSAISAVISRLTSNLFRIFALGYAPSALSSPNEHLSGPLARKSCPSSSERRLSSPCTCCATDSKAVVCDRVNSTPRDFLGRLTLYTAPAYPLHKAPTSGPRSRDSEGTTAPSRLGSAVRWKDSRRNWRRYFATS